MATNLLPVIRALIVCDDIEYLDNPRKQVSLINLISYFTASTRYVFPVEST